MIKEFKEFIAQGNVLDLAVAIILGVAFGAIVTSLVDDIIMPIVGMVLGGVDFASLSITVGSAAIAYGKFIAAIVNFLIVAFVVFLIVRSVKRYMEKAKEEGVAGPSEVELLAEIRDALKKKK